MLLVADAGEEVGLGHVARSSAIAAALAARGVATERLAHGATADAERDGVAWRAEPDPERIAAAAREHEVTVLDSYLLDPEALASPRLVAMHDSGEPPRGVALTIAPSAVPGDDPARLAGLRFACLGPRFWGLPFRLARDRVERVLVTTGGGDPGGVAGEVAAAVREAVPDAAVELVRGPQAAPEPPPGVTPVGPFDSLLEPLLAADLVVCGAGGTMLEAAATGTPAVAVPLAENQRPLAAALADAGGVAVASGGAAGAGELAGRLAVDGAERAALAERGPAVIDGYGALRVAFAIERLRSSNR